MLRECHRVLLPGGRLAGYLIHAREDLDGTGTARAVELGPAYGDLGAEAGSLLADGGFRLTHRTDVTPAFRDTLERLLAVRDRHQVDLRAEEGDGVFEETQERRRGTLLAVVEGLLVRTLWVAERV